MQTSIIRKLEQIQERHSEVSALLSDADTIANQDSYRNLSMEYAQLTPVVDAFSAWLQAQDDIDSAQEMLKDPDPDMKSMAEDELQRANADIETLELELQKLLLPKDPHDNSNIFLEIRAGTGGDEAAIFAGDLFRMYSRYAENNRWQVEILSESLGEHGGYREIIARIVGQGAYSRLKFESGAHRVQRVPETESQGRIHTSAATVAILPEADEINSVDINPSDLKVDTFRLRRRRTTRQQDRLGHPADTPPHRHRGGMPGRALATQEPRTRTVTAVGQAAGHAAGSSKSRRNRGAPVTGWQRRSL